MPAMFAGELSAAELERKVDHGLALLTGSQETAAPDGNPQGRLGQKARKLREAIAQFGEVRLQIFTCNLDGTGRKQLTFEGDNRRPDWSPDGTRIAYARGGQIWVMNADGSENTQVTQSERRKNGPSWSPDGQQMVFILAPGPTAPQQRGAELGIMNADGTGSSQLTASPNRRNADDPTWSPDGTKILFTTGRRGLPELWMMDAEGSYEVPLFPLDPYPFPGRASWQPVAWSH